MRGENSLYNQKIAFGCGVLSLLVIFCFASVIVVAVNESRAVAQFPGAEKITSHSNYSDLPFRYKWDDTYLITDKDFTDVYYWYSVTFDLGAEARAAGRCILLEGTQEFNVMDQYMSVFLCDTPEGQRVFVSRTTYYNR